MKTSAKKYPRKHLSDMQMAEKEEHVTMASEPVAEPHLMVIMWVDRNRRYFISSGGTKSAGALIYRQRWRTRHGVTRKEEISIQVPSVCEIIMRRALK